ncbi:MAG: chemotaxis protein CheA [Magnetococcales bacterium]|nr:chemotaxis protein CheA [Magnetococcales bacterium]
MFNSEEIQKALMEEFFSENREALGRIEQGLLRLESNPGNKELINAVFRDMHTVKGNCRMMSFPRLEELTHKGETLLDLMRDDLLAMNQEIGSLLLKVVDHVRLTLQEIARSGSEGEADFSTIIEILESFVPHEKGKESESADRHGKDPRQPLLEEELPQEEGLPQGTDDQLLESHDSKTTDGQAGTTAIPLPQGPSPSTLPPTSKAVTEARSEPKAAVSAVTTTTTDNGAPAAAPMESIRLSLSRLDALMNQVGELGASFNQLKYVITHRPDHIDQLLEVHGKQIAWLQDEVIKYRLQPIGRMWDQYHRLVRDLSVEMGKKVMLDLVGEKTEVDRNVLVSINELLGHLIRNALDHGIETPQERVQHGKSPIGKVVLSAEQRHGQIHLEVKDDGRGINPDLVVQKALLTGMITAEQAKDMSEAEIFKLIMLPGFSTASQVSTISGRGTGMDVVQAALSKMGGTLTIASTVGVGSQFRMSIPQTMAIVPALLVGDSNETFALPQVNVVELASFYGSEVAVNIEGKMQSPMVRVREKLLPLVPLQRLLHRDGPGRAPRREVERLHALSAIHVVVLQGQENLFGLEVGAILGHSSLLIKPINTMFAHIPILAGTAVMPDGSIAFLLNVQALLQGAGEFS